MNVCTECDRPLGDGDGWRAARRADGDRFFGPNERAYDEKYCTAWMSSDPNSVCRVQCRAKSVNWRARCLVAEAGIRDRDVLLANENENYRRVNVDLDQEKRRRKAAERLIRALGDMADLRVFRGTAEEEQAASDELEAARLAWIAEGGRLEDDERVA